MKKWNKLHNLVQDVLGTEYPTIDIDCIDDMKVRLRTSMEKRNLTDLYDIVFDMTLDFFDIDSPVWSSSPEGLLYTEVSCLYDEVSQNKIRALRALCGKKGFIPLNVYDWAITLNTDPEQLIATLQNTSQHDERDNGNLPCLAN